MLQSKISASFMCADLTRVREELRELKEGGIDYLHIDVMDGVFVPNITLSDSVVRQLRDHTDIPFDYHLMIVQPEQKLDWFRFFPGDMVSVHSESTAHICRAVRALKAGGVLTGVALNPATPVNALEYLLPYLDYIVVMTVDPGFAGQRLVESALVKIRHARKFLNERGYPDIMLEADGNVSFEHAAAMRAAGADVFVAGTSSIYQPGIPLAEGIARLRRCITEGGK